MKPARLPMKGCKVCGRLLPLQMFRTRRKPLKGGRTKVYRASECHDCHAAERRSRYPDIAQSEAERKARWYREVMADPQRAQAQREYNRERARLRRERARQDPVLAQRLKDAQKRYRDRVSADPAKVQARREKARIDRRLKQLDAGQTPNRRFRSIPGAYRAPASATARGVLPAGPFVAWLREVFPRDWTNREIADALGIPERRIYGLLSAGAEGVRHDVVDRAGCNHGAPHLLDLLYPVDDQQLRAQLHPKAA